MPLFHLSRDRGRMIFLFSSLALLFAVPVLHAQAEAAPKPNVLFIVIDDLNDYVGCLGGHPGARTPNIDALAESGLLFSNAHCNSPVCNPSRSSLWTGLRPTTTGITTNPSGWFRDKPEFRNIISLPRALGDAGYATAGFGKLFHSGHRDRAWPDWQQSRRYHYGPFLKTLLRYRDGDRLSDWGVPPSDPELRVGPQPSDPTAASFDEEIADRVIARLNDTHDRPFFLGCGFYRPHTPLYASRKWFDLFPEEEIELPPLLGNDNDDLPYFGKKPRREQDIEAPGLWDHDWVTKNHYWRAVIRAYLASIASVDAEVGRVVAALRQSPHADNTWLFLFSDHGWHLGEKKHWGKAALWEQTTRVPFIVVGPGIEPGGRCDQPVELLSLYPTVLDLVNIDAPHKLEGVSLRPLLKNPDAAWDHPAVTTFSDHHALRTDRWRYIRYVDGSEELYDHDNDPHEWKNLAVDPNHPELAALRARLDQTLTAP